LSLYDAGGEHMIFHKLRNRWAAIAHDMSWIPIAILLAYWIRFNLGVIPPEHMHGMTLMILVALPVQLCCFSLFKLYRGIWHFASIPDLVRIVRAVALGVLITLLILFVVSRLDGTPRSVIFLYPLLLTMGLAGPRLLYRWYKDRGEYRGALEGDSVLLIGAGRAADLLLRDMAKGRDYYPVGLLDDDPSKQGKDIHGVRVLGGVDQLQQWAERLSPSLIIFAIPSLPAAVRNKILSQCEALQLKVLVLPGLQQMTSDMVYLSSLRELRIEDLLGRIAVAPRKQLLDVCIRDKVVMVTGAGGSIGAELCRQILRNKPTKLILFEQHEFALYAIEKELLELDSTVLDIVPVLGSVTHQQHLERVLAAFKVQTVYHAAAYKHVPLVEYNPIEAVQNNVFGTWKTAHAAIATGVETFVLISTDKAVRPSNVMGASKRLSELALQALAAQSHATRICMVRFGNVLGSSGSVVPLFRKQIQNGGPVTVTHADITRYFMTIPEASQLVIQAGAMGQGGDVFVLDMGEPIKITDLAIKMIHLSGMSVQDESNPDGDVAIEFTGLRPGEKLYEELLIGDNVTGTEHPLIMRAQESMLPIERIQQLLAALTIASDSFDVRKVRDLLLEAVPEYQPQCDIKDLTFQQLDQQAGNVSPLDGGR